MPEHLEPAIRKILQAFCGTDPGRSVVCEGHRPWRFRAAIAGDAPRPAASVMKIALAMAVYRAAADGRIDLDRLLPVSRFPPTRYVSILAAFDPDRTLTVREICRLALITSDNPLAVHLAELVGFDAVNALLAAYGCGPPCAMAAGFSEPELGARNRVNVLTADAAAVLLHAIWSEPLHADLAIALTNNLRNHRIPALLPEHVQVMHKTGSLEGVVNDVGIVSDRDVAFTLAFLCDGQADAIQTSSEIAACARAVYDELKARAAGRPGHGAP